MLAGSIGGRVSLNRSGQTVSVQDYLEGEKESPIRHEYVEGYVYAMAGASDRHNRIALNIASRLNEQLIEGPCEVFISDMKLRVSPNVYYYPDVVVCCDSPPLDAYFRAQPVLIIEVTSPTTQRIDHHEKLTAYQHIPGVREFVLISQDQVRVEVHRRVGDEWRQEILSQATDLLALDSVGLGIKVAEVYRNVRFPD
jgi:Uma2 family endonuclease